MGMLRMHTTPTHHSHAHDHKHDDDVTSVAFTIEEDLDLVMASHYQSFCKFAGIMFGCKREKQS